MRLNVKVIHKYDVVSGDRSDGTKWRNQDVKLAILDQDGKETGETIVAKTRDEILIDAPKFCKDSTAIALVYFEAKDWNERCFLNASLKSFTPKDFKPLTDEQNALFGEPQDAVEKFI